MNQMKILMIDSGINLQNKVLQNKVIHSFEYIEGSYIQSTSDEFGHGTAIAGILLRFVDSITSIKVSGIENGIDKVTLVNILKDVYDFGKFNIINLSLGISLDDDVSDLYDICKRLSEQGCIIVSAFDNTGSFSYPAAFDCVIGVISSDLCKRIDEFEYIDDEVVNLAAKGGLQRVSWTNPEYMMVTGNSFACAHVTAQVSKYMKMGFITIQDILNEFKKMAIKRHEILNEKKFFDSLRPLFSIQRAAIFPFNKEIHSLVRFKHLLSFDIVDIYDYKYSGHIGATTNHILKEKLPSDYLIKNVMHIDWNKFDTLILGHTNRLMQYTNSENVRNNLITAALTRNKKIYSFDELNEYENNEFFYCPRVNSINLPPNRFGMLYRISKPVVGIFGTSSQQGKFTLQLYLRDALLKRGYDVGQIGTEPSALLYGMDYVFPIGYNSSVHINGNNTIFFINYLLQKLCIQQKDIILIGSQSGTIPYDTGNIINYTLQQNELLFASQPDAVILCINPYDEIRYIDRTIQFIEASVDCIVLAIVVFPMNINTDWKTAGLKEELQDEKYVLLKDLIFKRYNKMVYRLGNNDDMNQLVNQIVDFF